MGVRSAGSKRTKKSALSKANGAPGDNENCVKVVMAWFMREYGYDVKASAGKSLVSAEQATETLVDDRGRHPVWHTPNDDQGKKRWRDIESELGALPDGAYGLLRYRAIASFAHVTGWRKIEGRIEIMEGQQDVQSVYEGLNKVVAGSLKWVDLSGFKPTAATAVIVRR